MIATFLLRPIRQVARAQQYPMLSLFDEMNRFFSDSLPQGASSKAFNPSIDLRETAAEFILTGEFPGMEGGDVQLEIAENTITLSGEKRAEEQYGEGERTYLERAYGSFSRSISLGVEIDEENASAEMKNGILTVKIPKSAKAVRGAKKLTIKTT